MNIRANGTVGVVYTTETGLTPYVFGGNEGEGKEGWMQVNTEERQLVVRKRRSKKCVAWVIATEVEPMSHRKDGALF